MKKPKLVLLKGKVASGKTTALHTLRKRPEMKEWIIIDFGDLKHQFAHLGDERRRTYGKLALFSILKAFMAMKKNILLDEMSEKSLRKGINYFMSKYNYKIITFEFTVDIETSIQREAQRMIEKGQKPLGKKWVREAHEYHLEKFDSKGIIVDCNKLGKAAVVKLILENIR